MLVATIGRALAQKSRGLTRLEHWAISFQKHVSGARTSPLRGFREVTPAAATLRISGEGEGAVWLSHTKCCGAARRSKSKIIYIATSPHAYSTCDDRRLFRVAFETIPKAFPHRNVWFVFANGHTVSNAPDLFPPQRLTGTGPRK